MKIKTTNDQSKLSILVLVSFFMSFCHALDTINTSASLSGDQTITSANGLFELGFFNLGNSSNYYIGIWYKIIPVQTIVWIANRDKPVSDKYSSSLKISDDGNLVLVSNVSESPIWSTHLTSNISDVTEAVLLEKGNLVLRGAYNSTPPLWQSFDYPTDTILPGAKFGFDKKTRLDRVLASWKSSEDPGTGLYTQKLDRSSKQFVLIWNTSIQYWSSGAWNPEQRSFSQVPELSKLPPGYSYDFIDNENETYEMYDVNDPLKILVRQVTDVTGQMRAWVWFNSTKEWVLFWSKPEQQCNVHAICGAFSICNENSQPYCQCMLGFGPKKKNEWDLGAYSSGCIRNTNLNCGNMRSGTNRDKFFDSSSTVLPDHSHSVSVSSSDKCEEVCLRNCSCTAYSYDDNSCSIWFGDLLDVKQVASTDASGQTLHIRLAASEIHTSSHKNLVVGISVGVSAVIIVLMGVVSVVYWRKKRDLLMAAKSMENSFTRFAYRDLKYATRNFSDKLGRGGFGSVFKGTLPNSTVIAVKRLEKIDEEQGEKEFRAEVSVIATIQHVNLVRLRGFCSEGKKRMLVYEYMPNGSLDTHLFGKQESEILSWKARYQIAVGIAKGVAYLHEECRECIIHCDIKPENILLDGDYSAQVADFGLAKLLGREFSRVLTTIRGTRGYLAPEWILGEAITAKVDVYSYGMMLFELISGRRNMEQTSDGKMGNYFPNWALTKITQGEDVLRIVDPGLEGSVEKDEVMRISKLAGWCIQDVISHRPTMGQVVQVLEGVLDIDMPSIPRSLGLLAVDEVDNYF